MAMNSELVGLPLMRACGPLGVADGVADGFIALLVGMNTSDLFG